MDCFLYDNGLRHERVKQEIIWPFFYWKNKVEVSYFFLELLITEDTRLVFPITEQT